MARRLRISSPLAKLRTGGSDGQDTSLKACLRRIIGLRNMLFFSLRLRRILLRVVRKIGSAALTLAEEFTELLDKLSVCVEDVGDDSDDRTYWAKLILDVIYFSPRESNGCPTHAGNYYRSSQS